MTTLLSDLAIAFLALSGLALINPKLFRLHRRGVAVVTASLSLVLYVWSLLALSTHFPTTIVIDPSRSLGYSTTWVPGDLLVIDLARNRVVKTIALEPFSPGPDELFIDPTNTYLYMVNRGIVVFDLRTNARVTHYEIVDLATHPGSLYLYATTPTPTNDVIVIDPTRNEVVARMHFPEWLFNVQFDVSGRRIYVLSGTDTLNVIDVASNRIVTKLQGGYGKSIPDVRKTLRAHGDAFFYGLDGLRLQLINASTGKTVMTIAEGVNDMAIHPLGNNLYASVCCGGPGQFAGVHVVDTQLNKIIASVPITGDPTNMAMHPSGDSLYVVTSGGIVKLDTKTRTVATRIPICPRFRYSLCR